MVVGLPVIQEEKGRCALYLAREQQREIADTGRAWRASTVL